VDIEIDSYIVEKLMKSEHRHELKTNELAEWLANFPNWFKENLNIILYVTAGIIVIAAVGGYYWYVTNIQTAEQRSEFTNMILSVPQQKGRVINDQMRGSETSYVLLQSADGLELIAQSSNEDGLAALAYIKSAEILRSELHYRPRAITQAEKEKQINTAKRNYNQAILRSSSIPSLRSSAQYGLGLCEEELGNYAEAKKIYNEIINNVEFEGTTAVYQAEFRLGEMDNYQERVVFQTRPAIVEPIVPEVIPSNIATPELGIGVTEVNSPNQ
jgi:tetratricopeptide (TPR) repeat protein